MNRICMKKIIIFSLLLITNIVHAGIYTELGNPPTLRVLVLNWNPFYVYPQIPDTIDHESSDTYIISVWKEGPTGVRIPWAMPGPATEKYQQATYIRGEELPFTDISDKNTWKKKFGDQWMLIPVITGYVGIDEGKYIWTALNTRTGEEFIVLKLSQRGHIECGANGCIGVEPPLEPPNPPILMTRK